MKNLLSIVLLCYNSENKLEKVYSRLNETLNKESIPFELIIIDDGSKDKSFEVANNLERNFENVRAHQLSKNYTSHYAAFAGISISKGDCLTIIPDDEQQPYDTLVIMYKLWQGGNKIIIPYRETRNDPLISKFLSEGFYWFMNNFSEIDFPKGGADTFLIDKEIIKILNKNIRPRNTTTISEILRLGYNPKFIPYNRPAVKNQKSRWTLTKKIKLAKDFFYSSSAFPIKMIINSGILFAIISILVIVFYLYIKFFGNEDYWNLEEVPGWTSLIIIISFFSGLILLGIGILAEYVWRIYEEVKDRPGYIIKEK